jgi:uncharacterized membrane protein YdbT with pleckstrin-like domain
MEQTFESGVYYAPGKRVLYYFSVNRILPIIVIFIIVKIGLLFLVGVAGLKQILSASSLFLIIFALLFCVIAFIAAWIKYKSVQFMFDEYAFHIKKGFLSKSEIVIPYRQIQSINHAQSLSKKMLGIMNIVIETAGEDDSKGNVNSKGVLPILETDIALSIEKELLKRSNMNANKP